MAKSNLKFYNLTLTRYFMTGVGEKERNYQNFHCFIPGFSKMKNFKSL